MIYIDDSRNVRLLIDDSIEFVHAAANGDVIRVRQMLNNGVHPDTQGPKGWTGLRKAAARNKCEVAFELLNHGANVDATNYTGQTALIMACAYNHHQMATLLLSYGANPNLTNCGGRTALMIAASYGYSSVIGALLNKISHIDINKTDRGGKSALRMAAEYGHDEVAQMLEAASVKHPTTELPDSNLKNQADYVLLTGGTN